MRFIKQKQKNAQIFFVHGPGRTKRPLGHRVAHHGYLLTSCPGLYLCIYEPYENKHKNKMYLGL